MNLRTLSVASLLLLAVLAAGAGAAELKPVVMMPGESEDFGIPGDRLAVKLSGKSSGGEYSIIEANLQPGTAGGGLHMHRWHAETFYVLEGEIEFTIRDGKILALAGTLVFAPPNTPQVAKVDKPARMLIIYSLAGFEERLNAEEDVVRVK